MVAKKIISQKKNNILHIKFLIVSTILLAVLSFEIYDYFSTRYETELTNVQENKEHFVMDQIIHLTENNIIKESDESFKSSIESIIHAADINYLAIANAKDSIIIEFDPSNSINRNSDELIDHGKSNTMDDIHQTRKTFYGTNSQTLSLFCEFYRGDLNLRIQKAENHIGFISLLIFIISFLVLYAGSFIIMLPLRKLADSALEISSGDLNKRIPNKSKNEFSNIALSINSLSEDLLRANTQIEKLNKELKFHFRDKIGELNYEINQRRQAEHSLKQSEEQFRLLFELAPIGMVISAIFGKILKVNTAFHTALGYDENEIIGMQIKDLTHPEDVVIDVQLHDKLIEGIEQNVYYEKRLVRKDGEIIYVIVEAVVVKDKLGKPSHIIEQVIDITERKRVEKELIFAKEKAEESDRLKSAFLAQMSHEIRTPLNVILTAMSIIQDELDDTDEETKSILDSVSSAGKRLQRTIDLILNISAVQTGSYKPDNIDLDLERELKTLVEELKTLENDKDLIISFHNKAKRGIIVADHYSVMQIFQNLVGNAIKYTLKGSVEVILEDWGEDKLQVIIKDTGIGISKEYIANLFSPFSQEDVGYKREFEGNGLGLALVKKYCEINNADILVESEKNQGSTFSVIFNKKPTRLNGIKEKVALESNDIIELV